MLHSGNRIGNDFRHGRLVGTKRRTVGAVFQDPRDDHAEARLSAFVVALNREPFIDSWRGQL